jgi:threonylcarbamoyladenosine tRNA methylthiotransferase MtaB
LARGKSRNHSIEFILKEAGDIVSRGIKEVVLTGVNTGDFGKSTGERFEDLLRALDGVEGLKRIRISSIEPNLLSEEILKFISKSKKFLPHFHIPLQSGSNKILAAMKRRYNRELFLEKILLIRRYMPFAFIGVDVIVGFPGETSEDFADTFEFLESVSPSFLHVFPYSRRANTPAAEYSGQVRERDKSERVEALTKLSDKLYFEFKKMNIGRKEEVLYESTQKGGMMYGYTRNYIKVEREYDMKLIGEITEVVIG